MERKRWLTLTSIAVIVLFGIVGSITRESMAAGGMYKILGWNDLGMHCYNRDLADMAVLPPYNTLWVQVVKVADPPELVTSGIRVEYYYQDNTYSAGKTNFWEYDQSLFGVDLPLNVGLKGKGLSGTMDLNGDHFIAEGIPITEFSDSAPTVKQPYQIATVVVKDSTTGEVLTSTQVVTPTSSEMRCDNCHGDTGIARPSTPTGKVETNILQLHDEDSGTTLMANRPVLCASCHASNALGAPGQPGIKNLSKSMHEHHAATIPSTLDGCYNCHPGPQTRCLRDVMATEQGMTCVSCHGGMGSVSNNPDPWLNEPRCDACHNSGQYNQDQVLYRFSKGHGGLYCEACHDSTHAVAPSREPSDAIKFQQLQGKNGPIDECSVCHAVTPSEGAGPHSLTAPGMFADVQNDYWARTWIERLFNAGITGGCATSPLRYCPEGTVTRAQMAVLLLRGIHGSAYSPLAVTGSTGFSDVPLGYWSAAWIKQLATEGITSGCGSGNYCPEAPVTRAQMAVFLLRAKYGSGYTPPALGGSTNFSDVTPTYWAAAWIKQLAAEGITGGCGTGTYCPEAPVTRAQMAVFLVRTFNLP